MSSADQAATSAAVLVSSFTTHYFIFSDAAVSRSFPFRSILGRSKTADRSTASWLYTRPWLHSSCGSSTGILQHCHAPTELQLMRNLIHLTASSIAAVPLSSVVQVTSQGCVAAVAQTSSFADSSSWFVKVGQLQLTMQ